MKKMHMMKTAQIMALIGFITYGHFGVAQSISVWRTTANGNEKLQAKPAISFGNGSAGVTVNVDEQTTYQTMDGFGAAVSGSAAYLIQTKMSAAQRNNLLSDLFGGNGIRLSMVRHTVGASDFNQQGSYTYNDINPNSSDPGLNNFSIVKDRAYLIPTLQAVLARNNNIKVLGSPWSAPAWMKQSRTLNGGKLATQWYGVYAQYLTRYIQAYQQEGINVWALTPQNEPLHNDTRYPSMTMTPQEQLNFVKNNLGPTFASSGITTKIIAYDHNWDRPDYPITMMNDPGAKQYLAGSAFHAYAGEPTAQTQVHNAHPDKGIWFTEISGGRWSTNFGNNLSWNMRNIVIGTIRNWAKGVLFWNLALDQNDGPQNGGCNNCRGVVTIDRNNGSVNKSVEYYVLGHVSKFVRPGAQRIASSHFTNSIQSVAFKNPDQSIVLVTFNASEGNAQTFTIQYNGRQAQYTLPAGAAATFTWEREGNGGGSQPVSNGRYKVVAKHNNRLLAIPQNNTSNGAKLLQQQDNGSRRQQWDIRSQGGAWYTLDNASSGRCMDVTNGSSENGTRLQQWDCFTGSPNQQFRLRAASGGYYEVVASNGKCLDVDTGGSAEGAKVQLWDCDVNQANRLFKLESVAGNRVALAQVREPIIYPNPANGLVSLDIGSKIQVKVQIVDQLGKLRLEETYESSEIKIDVSGLSQGIYRVNVFKDGEPISSQQLFILE